jgi:retron-type reverse transcriptase
MTWVLKQVQCNRGALGADYLKAGKPFGCRRVYWPTIRDELIEVRYRPHPLKRVFIPKSDRRQRWSGVAPVVDRFIPLLTCSVRDSLAHRLVGLRV